MDLTGEAKLLRIFIGEADKLRHTPLYEAIIREARTTGLAGATAWRGVMSYGHGSHIRTAKILDLSTDLPMVIEITDCEDRINAFLPTLDQMFKEAACGGLVTIEKVQVITYTHGRNRSENTNTSNP
jgi:PII-like signaling protein